jgi:hypothetical protein
MTTAHTVIVHILEVTPLWSCASPSSHAPQDDARWQTPDARRVLQAPSRPSQQREKPLPPWQTRCRRACGPSQQRSRTPNEPLVTTPLRIHNETNVADIAAGGKLLLQVVDADTVRHVVGKDGAALLAWSRSCRAMRVRNKSMETSQLEQVNEPSNNDTNMDVTREDMTRTNRLLETDRRTCCSSTLVHIGNIHANSPAVDHLPVTSQGSFHRRHVLELHVREPRTR